MKENLSSKRKRLEISTNLICQNRQDSARKLAMKIKRTIGEDSSFDFPVFGANLPRENLWNLFSISLQLVEGVFVNTPPRGNSFPPAWKLIVWSVSPRLSTESPAKQ